MPLEDSPAADAANGTNPNPFARPPSKHGAAAMPPGMCGGYSFALPGAEETAEVVAPASLLVGGWGGEAEGSWLVRITPAATSTPPSRY